MTMQNAALVEQTAAASLSLSEQAERLSALVGRFRLSARSDAESQSVQDDAGPSAPYHHADASVGRIESTGGKDDLRAVEPQ
jgi:hypothetical protein